MARHSDSLKEDQYLVTVELAAGRSPRTFLGDYYAQTWDNVQGACDDYVHVRMASFT